jgi:hypothetical protein
MKVRIGNVDVTFTGYVHIGPPVRSHKHPDNPDHRIIEDPGPLDVFFEDGDFWIERSKP